MVAMPGTRSGWRICREHSLTLKPRVQATDGQISLPEFHQFTKENSIEWDGQDCLRLGIPAGPLSSADQFEMRPLSSLSNDLALAHDRWYRGRWQSSQSFGRTGGPLKVLRES